MAEPLKLGSAKAAGRTVQGGNASSVVDASRARTEPEMAAAVPAPPAAPKDVFVAPKQAAAAGNPRLTSGMPALQAPYSTRTLSTASVFNDKTGTMMAATRNLQQGLVTLGFLDKTEVTGNYLANTSAAVKQFQQSNSLPADGNANWTTQSAIRTQAEAKRSAQGLGPTRLSNFAIRWQG